MSEEKKPVNYMASLNKARRKRNRPPYEKYAAAAAVVLLAAGGIFLGSRIVGKDEPAVHMESSEGQETGEVDAAVSESVAASIAESESAAVAAAELKHQQDIQAVIDSYSNLGIVQVSGYLNIRKDPHTGAHVVGKLPDGSACEIQEELDGWYHINSGGIDGYISSEYVLTGEEAREAAEGLVMDRAIVLTDNLNIRQEPSTDANVMGQCLEGERYEIIGETDEWYQIPSGYISKEYSEKRFCLNEARKLELRAMVLNYYDRPGVSNVSNYLNIRSGPSESDDIIAKLPSYAGCEILEELDGWYKIRSGNITGYVSSDYILTGDEARMAAMDHAELMAVVSTDGLRVRTEPSTDAKIWTQISSNERYRVVNQLDGWVQIEFDEGSDSEEGEELTAAYVSSEYVDVRYALAEAIKFSPAEENASLRNQIVNYAMQFLGNPYVWGGTSLTNGADCSGFTMSVMAHFGISLPHYSGSQAQKGTRITSSQMRPGDLIFYANSGGTINHVAMYIGNGQIIHAASRKSGIKLSTWNYRSPVRIVDVIGD